MTQQFNFSTGRSSARRLGTAGVLTMCIPAFALFAQPALAQSTNPNLSASGVPEVSRTLQEELRPYLNVRQGGVVGWLPNGSGVVITTRFAEAQQLHIVSKPGGARRQISFGDEPVGIAVVSRATQANHLLFLQDTGGNEQFQIYRYDFADQKTTALTSDTSIRYENLQLAPDGKTFATASADAKGDYRVLIGDASASTINASIKLKTVLAKPGAWYPMQFSNDGKYLLVQKYTSVLQSVLYELNLANGKLLTISAERNAAIGGAIYSKAGDAIYFIGDQGKEYRQVFRFDRKSKKISPLISRDYQDVEEIALSSDGASLATNFNVDGASVVRIYDLADPSKVKHEIGAPPSVISNIQFHPNADQLLMQISSPQVAGDAVVYNLSSESLTQWTEHEVGGLNAKMLVLPQRIQTESGVGKKLYNLQAWVYYPGTAEPAPVLIIIHGGPESQARPVMDPWVQFLVRERKMAVVIPNIRGSTGYGRTYTGMDDGVLREDAIVDIGAITDWIAAQKGLDGKRIAIMGGSYGGFAVLAALQKYPERFKAGVDIVGISDFTSFLKNTSNYRRDLRRQEYGDERDPKIAKFFDAISPLKNASKINAPLFVIQGANDPRVPASEATQIIEAVRANGKPVWTLVAANEGHGFKKKANVDYMRAAIALFLQQHLLTP
jgi:dipeptidyl aminopeptidase/acylaminoacyl peptidase